MSILRPINEQETILNFISKYSIHHFEIINMWSSYPDARIRDTIEDILYEVEFEYKLSSFIKHGHDPFKCNFVICWINDVPDFPLTVWEVSKDSYPDIKIPDEESLYQLKMLIDKRKNPVRSKNKESISDGVFDSLREKLGLE